MKILISILALFSFNAVAVEFPSKEVDRKGISGNLKQTASNKQQCVKEIADAALKQMKIKGLKADKVEYHADLSQRLMKATNDRGFRVTFKDDSGKSYTGAIRVMFFHPSSGIACRPLEVDVSDGSAGTFYQWKMEPNHESGSLKYRDLPKEFLASAGPEHASCMKDPACAAAVQAVSGAQLAAPSTAIPAGTAAAVDSAAK